MSLPPVLSRLPITPELRAFLRAELAQVIRFETPDGMQWTPGLIALQVKENALAGKISEDTIARFVNKEEDHRIRRPAIVAIAAFLIEFEFIVEDDIRHYAKPTYARAASALAQLFSAEQGGGELTALAGVYRSYRIDGDARLVFSELTLASPDRGRSLSVVERRAAWRLIDTPVFLEETDDLDPRRFSDIPAILAADEDVLEASAFANGVAVRSETALLILTGGGEAALHDATVIFEEHWADGAPFGMRGVRGPERRLFFNGERRAYNAPEELAPLSLGGRERLAYYAHGRKATVMPEIDKDEYCVYQENIGDSLDFVDSMAKETTRRERILKEAEARDIAFEEALLKCPDETARLALSISAMRNDPGIAAVDAGADLNVLHPQKNLPMIHAAASFGMRRLVRKMMASEACDLTVRDRFMRLASTCADNNAGDFELRDELIDAQIAQFRARGIDPRRPNVPGYGAMKLRPEP